MNDQNDRDDWIIGMILMLSLHELSYLNLYSKPLDALNLSHSLFDRWEKVKTVISEAAEVTIGKKP